VFGYCETKEHRLFPFEAPPRPLGLWVGDKRGAAASSPRRGKLTKASNNSNASFQRGYDYPHLLGDL